MNLEQFLSDGSVAVVLGLVFASALYIAYLGGRIGLAKRLSADLGRVLARLEGDPVEASQTDASGSGAPLIVRYLASAPAGADRDSSTITQGTATLFQFTFADWHRDPVQQAIRAALEAELPGMRVHSFEAVNMLEEWEAES